MKKNKLYRKLFLPIVTVFFIINVFAYHWPTIDKYITSDFGPRDRGQGWEFHPGIDIRANIGSNVYAIAAGTVSVVDNIDDSKAGKWIAIDHGNFTSRYLHLNKINVSKGEFVQAGQIIGESGNTGGVDAHLHFDMPDKWPYPTSWLHPLKYLPYDDTGPPVITNVEPTVYEDGGIIVVKGVIGIKAEVDTTADKDLNEVKFYVDGEEKYSISYDPKTNCTEETVEPLGLGEDRFKWDNLDTTGLSEGTHFVNGSFCQI